MPKTPSEEQIANVIARPFDESLVVKDPYAQFAQWYDEAGKLSRQPLANAMTLATADRAGIPTARIVLLKQFDQAGFVFFTNYRSRKGAELDENPRAGLLFYWGDLERQIRIDGTIEKVTRAENEEYFATRARRSQIGAHASAQSMPLQSRTDLEQKVKQLEAQFHGKDVPCPPQWGGYRVKPLWFEFWQGRESRLHDRIIYKRVKGEIWKIERLAP